MLPQAGNNKAQRSCSQQSWETRGGTPRLLPAVLLCPPPQPKILIWGVLQLKHIQPGFFECLLFPLPAASLEGSNDTAKDPFSECQKMEAAQPGARASLTPGDLQPPSPPPPPFSPAQPKQSALPRPVWADLSRAAYFCRGLPTGQHSALLLSRGFGSQAMLHQRREGRKWRSAPATVRQSHVALETESPGSLQACLGRSFPRGWQFPSCRLRPNRSGQSGRRPPCLGRDPCAARITPFPSSRSRNTGSEGKREQDSLATRAPRVGKPWPWPALPAGVMLFVPGAPASVWISQPGNPELLLEQRFLPSGRLLEVCSQCVPLRQMQGGRPISRLPATVTEEALTVSDRAICRLGSSSTHPGKFIYSG